MANSDVKLRPLGDKVIVEVIDEPQTTASGLVLPDTAKEKSQRGKVLAVGPGTWRPKRSGACGAASWICLLTTSRSRLRSYPDCCSACAAADSLA